MTFRGYFVLLAAFLFAPLSAFAQMPSMPFEDKGACPFECCVYRTWVANKATAIRSKRGGSSTAFNVKRREKVTAVTGVVITTQYGTMKTLRATTVDGVRIRANETLYLLTYLGEGFYKAWYKGRLLSASDLEDSNLKVTSQPEAVWWIQIKNKNGKIGWTNLPENFDNKDECG